MYQKRTHSCIETVQHFLTHKEQLNDNQLVLTLVVCLKCLAQQQLEVVKQYKQITKL
jgi:hypothetical protein